jgi:hypothetical protein
LSPRPALNEIEVSVFGPVFGPTQEIAVPAKQDDKSKGDGSPIDRFKRMVGEGSLYAPCSFSEHDVAIIASIIGNAGLQIDLDCPGCKALSTFVLPPIKAHGQSVLDPYKPSTGVAERPISQESDLEQVVRALELRCARNQAHRVEFILRMKRVGESVDAPASKVEGGGPHAAPMSTPRIKLVFRYTLVKIGQHPPHAELVAGRLKAVSKIADPLDMRELRRAAGLISHDAAIGAFVYLRRVFERIIKGAWQRAIDAGETLPEPVGLRMPERIAALKNHLPDIVVTNAKVYGILSLGLHELTEEECAQSYPLVEESVIAMLEEAYSHLERRKREGRIAAELTRLSSELGKNS